MKKTKLENLITEAKIGYLTKDEFRKFQENLINDHYLAEKAQSILQFEVLNFLNMEAENGLASESMTTL